MRQIVPIIKDSDWTQTDVATHCGVTQPRINDLLHGRASRSLDHPGEHRYGLGPAHACRVEGGVCS